MVMYIRGMVTASIVCREYQLDSSQARLGRAWLWLRRKKLIEEAMLLE